MTAICGGGTSSAQPGFSQTIALSVPAIAALLNNIPTVWAVPFAAYLGLITLDLTTFCTTDPPAVPTITALDAINLLNVANPLAAVPAGDKFQQLIGAYAWYKLCKCDSVATPAPPAAPAAPANLPQFNPPAVSPSAPTGQPCAQSLFTDTVPNDGAQRHTSKQPIPAGTTLVTLDGIFPSLASCGSPGLSGFITFYTAAGAIVGSTIAVGGNASSSVTHGQAAPPATATQWDYGTLNSNCTSAINLISTVSFYCGTTPNATGGPLCVPCPPDPILTGMLSQILDMVRLIQRQKAPFAYVPGTRHNGLSGNGQFAVQGLIGVSVILATLPAYLGSLAGDPVELFDVGWVTLGTADGWHRSVRIEHSPTLIMPIEGSETLLGWSLSPGVVVDVLELVREP